MPDPTPERAKAVDDEIEAVVSIIELFEKLDPEAQQRVLVRLASWFMPDAAHNTDLQGLDVFRD